MTLLGVFPVRVRFSSFTLICRNVGMVDMLLLESSALVRVGSTPSSGTNASVVKWETHPV